MGTIGATETRLPLQFKGGPVNTLSQLHQWMLQIDKFREQSGFRATRFQ